VSEGEKELVQQNLTSDQGPRRMHTGVLSTPDIEDLSTHRLSLSLPSLPPIVEHTPPDISFLPINLLSCIALTPRATHFSKLEDVLSGARASAKHSWKPENPVLPQNLASAD